MIYLNTQYAWEMIRNRRLRSTIREDIAWDILVEEGGATHTIKIQCLPGQTANIDWGDNTSTTATETTLTSYAHDYPAGTFEISITGGVYRISNFATGGEARTTKIISLNCPGIISLEDAFRGGVNTYFDDNCKIATSTKILYRAFLGNKFSSVPSTLQIPAGVTSLMQMFHSCSNLAHVPLSIWPSGGFTSSTIDIKQFAYQAYAIRDSIAPSNILWDAANTFTIDTLVFYSSQSWLNYASAYTDPVSGITYSKIPYAWGGAAD